jgi:hypothetical protein
VRLVVQCDNGVASAEAAIGKCLLRGSGILTYGNNLDVIGFDIGNSASMGHCMEPGWTGSGSFPIPSTTGNSTHYIGNYCHDLGSSVSNSAGITGCPENGAINMGGTHGYTMTDQQVIRNIVLNFGRGRDTSQTCNTAQGIYNGQGSITEGNIVINVPDAAYQMMGCRQTISNNIGIGARNGLILYDADAETCPGGNLGASTIDNNYFGFMVNFSIYYCCSAGRTVCTAATPNYFGHNYSDGVAPDSNHVPFACDVYDPSPLTHLAGASAFIDYQTTSFGDYHPKSPLYGAGTTRCTTGGFTPCVPHTDFYKNVFTVQDVGAVASGTAAPPPPGNGLDDTLTNWKTCYIGSCSGGGSPGGTGTPTAGSVHQTIGNASPSTDGASMKVDFIGPAFTNVLWTHTNGSADTTTDVSVDWQLYLSANCASMQAVESDMFNFDKTRGTKYMWGMQCNKTSGKWQIWDELNTAWVNTAVTCALSCSAWHHVVQRAHSIAGDTAGCSGHPCLYYDSVSVDGTDYPINQHTPSGPLPSTWTSNVGWQIQLDTDSGGSGGVPISMNVDEANFTFSTKSAPLPFPPMNLKCTVGVSWLPSTSTPPFTYSLYRGTISGGPYTLLASQLTGTSFTDNTATCSATSYYVVQTVQGTTISANSPEASATPLNFGLLKVGNTLTHHATLSNPTTGAGGTGISISGTDASSYSQSGCGSSLAAGAQCTLAVGFSPLSNGALDAVLNAGQRTAALTGTGSGVTYTLVPKKLIVIQ